MSEETGTSINFDGVSYDVSELTDDAKYCVHCLQQCEREIQETKMRTGLLMEAYASFTEKLKAELPEK